MDERRVVDKFGRVHGCEGQGIIPHECSGGVHMHEVFHTKKHVMKMSAKNKRYINHEINCSIVCGNFHTLWGSSEKFKSWFEYRQRERYGNHAVDKYFSEFPSKLNTQG